MGTTFKRLKNALCRRSYKGGNFVLLAIDRILSDGTLHMEVIVNTKTLDNGLNIIQLEQAVGAAIKCFEGSVGIVVPRSRFLPVKKTDDLLLVMSNLYSLQNGSLVMSPLRMFPTTPLVKLGPNHFAKVKVFGTLNVSILFFVMLKQ